MLPQCSHITRKWGIYYYRRRLPKPFCGEITVSLRTKIFLEADWLSRSLNGAFERALQRMTETSNQRADIARIAKRYFTALSASPSSFGTNIAAQPTDTNYRRPSRDTRYTCARNSCRGGEKEYRDQIVNSADHSTAGWVCACHLSVDQERAFSSLATVDVRRARRGGS